MRLQLKLNQNADISFVPQIFFKEWESLWIKNENLKTMKLKNQS